MTQRFQKKYPSRLALPQMPRRLPTKRNRKPSGETKPNTRSLGLGLTPARQENPYPGGGAHPGGRLEGYAACNVDRASVGSLELIHS